MTEEAEQIIAMCERRAKLSEEYLAFEALHHPEKAIHAEHSYGMQTHRSIARAIREGEHLDWAEHGVIL